MTLSISVQSKTACSTGVVAENGLVKMVAKSAFISSRIKMPICRTASDHWIAGTDLLPVFGLSESGIRRLSTGNVNVFLPSCETINSRYFSAFSFKWMLIPWAMATQKSSTLISSG